MDIATATTLVARYFADTFRHNNVCVVLKPDSLRANGRNKEWLVESSTPAGYTFKIAETPRGTPYATPLK